MPMERYVATLMANPVEALLTQETAGAAAQACASAGASCVTQEWLEPGEAYDLVLEGLPPEKIRACIAASLGKAPYDVMVQPLSRRRKRGLICDMDSTMIPVECVDELADYAGMKPEVSAITAKAMNGELDFREALRARVQLLENLPESVLHDTYNDRVTFSSGARELVQTMRRHGAFTMLVSGGFTYFTARVKDALGFHADQANELEIRDGKLTGKVIEPILDKDAKTHAFEWLCGEQGIEAEDVMALGDGANDIPMLQAAGLGIAYRAKPAVRTLVPAQLNYCDLSALLYAQGYRKEEFVS